MKLNFDVVLEKPILLGPGESIEMEIDISREVCEIKIFNERGEITGRITAPVVFHSDKNRNEKPS